MLFRLSCVLLATSLIAACVTVQPPTVDQQTIRSYSLNDVVVDIQWANDGESEEAVIRASGRDPNLRESAEYIKTAEGQQKLKAHIGSIVRLEFVRVVSPHLQGPKKAKLMVKVASFDVPSAARRVIVGGHYQAAATVTMVDSATGVPVVTSPVLNARVIAGQGPIQATVEAIGSAAVQARPVTVRLSEQLARDYGDWLLQKP